MTDCTFNGGTNGTALYWISGTLSGITANNNSNDGIAILHSTDWSIDDFSVEDNGGWGMVAGGASVAGYPFNQDFTISNGYGNGNGDGCIGVDPNDTVNYAEGYEYDVNGEVYDNECVGVGGTNGISASNTYDLAIYRNIVSGYTSSCIIFNGRFGNIYKNTVSGCDRGIQAGKHLYWTTCGDHTIHRNTISGNTTYGVRLAEQSGTRLNNNSIRDEADGIHIEEANDTNVDVDIYNNTIDSPSDDCIQVFGAGTGTVDADIKNNICHKPGDDFIMVENGYTANIDADYNAFYKSGSYNDSWTWGATTDIDDLSAWQSTSSQDANSRNTDPLFVNESINDYRLKPNSPYIDAGTWLSNHTHAQGTKPDIGYIDMPQHRPNITGLPGTKFAHNITLAP